MNTNYNKELNTIYIEITSKCNYKCIYCYNDSSIKKQDDINVKHFINLVAIAKQRLNTKQIIISGGEPLLHPYLMEMCQTVFDNNMNLKIITNGSLLSAEKIKKIKKYEPVFQITLDSHIKSINDKYKGNNAFNQTINGINNLNEYYDMGKVIIRCNLNYHNINIDDVNQYVNYLKCLNIEYAYFSLINCVGRATEKKYPNRKKSRDKLTYLLYYTKKTLIEKNITIVAPVVDVCQACPYSNVALYKGNYLIHIDPKGLVYPCSYLVDNDYVIGDIKNEDIDKIWYGSKMNTFLHNVNDRLNNIEECKNCIFRDYCGKGCVAECITNAGFYMTDGQCDERRKSIKKLIKLKYCK